MRVDGYDGSLLRLAQDLGDRLLPAFDEAPAATGLPYAFVHLQHGVVSQPVAEQCTAGIGTNLLEFAVLSNLTADDRYARASLGALRALWALRSEYDLLGNTIDIHTGRWLNSLASIGAGSDSFYEYLAKGALLLDSHHLHAIFARAYRAVGEHLQLGPHFAVAPMHNPAGGRQPAHGALQAFWPGLQVLVGDAQDAISTHAPLMAAWDKVGVMPEQYTLKGSTVIAGHVPYPLRPEVAESTLALFQATGSHEYLRFGERMIQSINLIAKAPFGFASVRSVATGALEDHMPSFFLAETLKYLYLLFDPSNPLHSREDVMLSTEAHLLPRIGSGGLRDGVWDALTGDGGRAEPRDGEPSRGRGDGREEARCGT
jgi:mannosidase alpha-like ER degradation enhancer 1